MADKKQVVVLNVEKTKLENVKKEYKGFYENVDDSKFPQELSKLPSKSNDPDKKGPPYKDVVVFGKGDFKKEYDSLLEAYDKMARATTPENIKAYKKESDGLAEKLNHLEKKLDSIPKEKRNPNQQGALDKSKAIQKTLHEAEDNLKTKVPLIKTTLEKEGRKGESAGEKKPDGAKETRSEKARLEWKGDLEEIFTALSATSETKDIEGRKIDLPFLANQPLVVQNKLKQLKDMLDIEPKDDKSIAGDAKTGSESFRTKNIKEFYKVLNSLNENLKNDEISGETHEKIKEGIPGLLDKVKNHPDAKKLQLEGKTGDINELQKAEVLTTAIGGQLDKAAEALQDGLQKIAQAALSPNVLDMMKTTVALASGDQTPNSIAAAKTQAAGKDGSGLA